MQFIIKCKIRYQKTFPPLILFMKNEQILDSKLEKF